MFPPFELCRSRRLVEATEEIVTAQHAAEFSRPVAVARVRDGQLRIRIAATDVERVELAKRLGVLTLERLEAEVALAPTVAENGVRLAVDWAADVVQSCVVSLEPVATKLNDSFELLYARAERLLDSADSVRGEVQIDAEGGDPPEPLIGDRIDIGEAVVEHIALALDPYPRKPGASVLAEYVIGQEATNEPEVPFAALAELVNKR